MPRPRQSYALDQWVAQTRGPGKGRVGQVVELIPVGPGEVPLYVVQFGSSGPFHRLQETSLRRPTAAQLAFAHGCRVRALPAKLRAQCSDGGGHGP